MIRRDEASTAQVIAARPDASTWLAANAGSGKTRVLTDRVARLLLDKVEPQHILCLTYTKAAASEMQNRLFKRLGAWAMLEDASLILALQELGIDGGIDAAQLKQARTLFARAIETPGGLKIQTIHSFCASLLRRFPLEAHVSPQFKEIEERAADLLRAEMVDTMADGPDAQLVSDLARHYAGEDFGSLTKAIVQSRAGFAQPLDFAGCLTLFDQDPSLTADAIQDSVFLGEEQELIDHITPTMLAKGGNDSKAAEKLRQLGPLGLATLPALEKIFLTGKTSKSPFSAKIGAFPTKATQGTLAHNMPALNDFMVRVQEARQARIALKAAGKTHALHRFAARFLPLYEEAKTLRGWLDFDDLIDRARALLNDSKVAAWVLWRIDGGIDHILVDEAQDTSPAQWDVIRKLAAEFSAGQGARDNGARTIFVVGDKKQSIYSFQGADPREFDRMQSEFQEKIEAADMLFQDRSLAYSFRSSPAILDVVDQTFKDKENAGFTDSALHKAFKSKLPGRVDLWPLIENQPDEEDGPWHTPLDRKSPTHHSVVLANQVADNIKWMIQSKQTIPIDGTSFGEYNRRPVQAGDFLILVQRRSTLFSEIIRACKNADLNIAGADRLKVGGELAVRDLSALLSFLAVPEDDLSLASALKSPLFGWDEQTLFSLAHARSEDHLWQALRTRSNDFPSTFKILTDLRNQTDFLRPYDLIERILTRHKGRANLLARLGAEAEDGINALLSQALAFERNTIPSLTGFLDWMETDDLEIKRQVDSASNQIRVMTVHGAKGLEAPIVILPDSGKRNIQVRDEIVNLRDVPAWKTASDDMPDAMSDAVEDRKSSEAQERLRLLYVALTRAEKWLIVAAAGDLPKEGSWYQFTEEALDALSAELIEFGKLTIKRYARGDWDNLPLISPTSAKETSIELESCFSEPACMPAAQAEIISPSDLGGAKALPGQTIRDEDAAMAYGTLVHQCLEHLAAIPTKDRATALVQLSNPDSDDASAALSEAQCVLNTPNFSYLFGTDSLSEVPISANLGKNRLHGTIDRLLVETHRVLAVDFKTNQTVPATPEECPEGILRQMGAYAHALQQIYPNKQIDTAILWTRTCILMPLPHDIVRTALLRTPYLDAAHQDT
ncbi:MAG: double-strand break repair helicase AddA [Roseobacter sp.]